jgi:diguanylate cyclase (GGDEF)-like protein
MPSIFSVAPQNLEEMRQRVLERFASLIESQTRTHHFAMNVGELIHDFNAEISNGISSSIELLKKTGLNQVEKEAILARLSSEITHAARLDSALELLLGERQRQWHENGEHLKEILLEFSNTVESLAGTLIEKDLLERQSHVLENIIISHEKVSQWRVFVQEILSKFHAIFPFNFFFIAFAEEHGLALYLYFLGDYSDDVRSLARQRLTREMLAQLKLPLDALLDIEEFIIPVPGKSASVDDIKMITVSVPDLELLKLSGILGVAYGSVQELTPQESSVIRSILAVMVMVVGSSKALSKTMSELEFYSTHDPLTGLYNRRYFNDMLEYEIGRSGRHRHEFSVLMLDLDDFKDVNDTYGHPCGDTVLRRLAEVMRSVMRLGDLATRIGGDEFAIILTETGREGAMVVAEKLRTELREIVFDGLDGKTFHITTSIGVVTFPGDAQSMTDLMAGVDIGLYHAKETGKDSVCTVDAVEDKVQASRIVRDNAEKFREGLRDDRIIPYFQPIVDCRSGKIFAYETLARYREPNGETLPAGMFIETLERYGMGRELDRVMIQKSLTVLKQHIAEHGDTCKLFINLSAQEIQGRGVLGFAEQVCHELEIPPHNLVFEILERDAIGDMTHMRKFLTELRKKGFSFALDDFGSGYNSFHYLRELHFEFVKLDGAFVRNILNSKIDFSLVGNLSRLCQDLGILMVAEFVESQEILEALQAMGVDYAQGYHLGVPTPRMQLL